MFWPDTQTGVDVQPERKAVQSAVRKYFTEGGVGVHPTIPGGDWFNQITNELLNVLAAADIDPSKTDDDQLLRSIEHLIENSGAAKLRSDLTGGGSLGCPSNVIIIDLPPFSGDFISAVKSAKSNTTFILGNKTYDIRGAIFPLATKNIRILGSMMPSYSDDGSRLEGGTILRGGTNVFGPVNWLTMSDLGIDVGQYVVDEFFNGISQDGLVPAGNFNKFDNIRVLIKSDATQPHHGILFERITGVQHGFLETRGGYHGYVVKANDVIGGEVKISDTSGTSFIVKADQGITYHNIEVKSISYAGDTNSIATSEGIFECITGGTLANVRIGTYNASHINNGIRIQRDGTGNLSDITIGSVIIHGSENHGIDLSKEILRFTVSDLHLLNCKNTGIYIDSQSYISLGCCEVINAGASGIHLGGNADRSRISLGNVAVYGCGGWGIKNDANIPFVDGQLTGSNNSSGLISSNFGDVTIPPSAGWSNDWFPFVATKVGRLVRFDALLLSNKSSKVIAHLPDNLIPAKTEVFCCNTKAPVLPGASTVVRLFIHPENGNIEIDSTAVSSVDGVSLTGITYFSKY